MRIALFLFWLTVLAGSLALPQATSVIPPQKKQAPAPKKTAATKTATKAAPHKAAATTKTAKTSSKSSKKAAPARRYGQLAPTPERYRDIQTALADKGYLNQEPNGVWDSQSVDAMRRFQTDQKLAPTGKITASALIGLGLGPKTSDSPVVPPAISPPASPAVPPVVPPAAPPEP